MFDQIGGFAEVVSFIAALVATALSALLSVLVEGRRRSQPKLRTPSDVAKEDQLVLQIKEIDEYLRRQERQASANGALAFLLNISQYGVAAALVSSVVNENISAQIVGVLGVVTLLSSFMVQLIKPSARKQAADDRAIRLRELRRRAEISLAEIQLSEKRGHPAQDEVRFERARAFLTELHAIQREEAA